MQGCALDQYIDSRKRTIIPIESIKRETYMNSRELIHGSPRQTMNPRSVNPRKWAALVSGAAAAVYGITRKSWTGAALAGAGGYLIYSGVRAAGGPKQFEVKRSITVNKPAQELYQ